MRIVVTVDYEVFGDGSGPLDACVCRPGSRLRSVLRDAGMPGVFFVEPLELMSRARGGAGAAREVDGVVEQLAGLAEEGHELGLHLHPQWLPAALGRSGTREWDPRLWRFGDLAADARREALQTGRDWLLRALRSAGIEAPDLVSFRAGGWCVQPLQASAPALAEAGFRVDSSVAPGLSLRESRAWFDFRDVSTQEASWHVDEAGEGALTEIPIATGRLGWLRRMAAEGARRTFPGRGRFPEGCSGSYAGPDGDSPSLAATARRIAAAAWTMADYCALDSGDLMRLALQWDRTRRPGVLPDVPLVLIGHTKNFTAAAEGTLSTFLSDARRQGWQGSTFRDLVQSGGTP